MNINNLVEAMASIEENRNVSQEIIIDALKEALTKAFRKQINIPDANVSIEVDEKGEMRLYQQYEVVEEVEDDELQVEYKEIIKRDPNLEIGQFYKIEFPIEDIGRGAALLAKQVLKQKIREAEKQAVYDEYIDKLDEMIIGEIESVEEKFSVVNLGKALAIMPRAQQIPGEMYREGQRYRVVITEVIKDTKGAQVIVSRSDEKLVKRLFEKEVPEIYDGVVEIKAIAREAGERTKMAVYSKNPEIDPIGACIGPRGSRVQVVIEELKGEKIDIFEWSDNPIELIKNALSPAQVLAVFPNPEKKGLIVVVDDGQLSLAIGKRGKNARLAVRLTGSKIDIKSETEMSESGVDSYALMADYQASIDEKRLKKLAQQEVIEEEVVIDEIEVDEVIIDEIIEEVEELEEIAEVEEVVEVIEEIEEIEEIKEEITEIEDEEEEEIVVDIKQALKPRHDYVSKFEELAAGKKTQEQFTSRRRKDRDSEKRINTAELLKEIEYEIKPEYSEEELAEIEEQKAREEASLWDDDIDYDAFDDYYDED